MTIQVMKKYQYLKTDLRLKQIKNKHEAPIGAICIILTYIKQPLVFKRNLCTLENCFTVVVIIDAAINLQDSYTYPSVISQHLSPCFSCIFPLFNNASMVLQHCANSQKR